MAMLESMDKAHEVFSKSELNCDNINEKIGLMNVEIQHVMKHLDLTVTEALWFSIIYNISMDDIYVSFKSMANYLQCRVTLIYRFGREIGLLVSKGLLKKEYRINRMHKLSENFIITDFARKLVQENLKYKDEKNKHDFNRCAIANVVEEIKQAIEYPLFDFDQVDRCYQSIDLILKNNLHVCFAKTLSTIDFREQMDKILLCYYCVQYISGYDGLAVSKFLNRITHNDILKQSTLDRYKNKRSELFDNNWVRFTNNLENQDFRLSLTDKAYNIILKKDFPKIEIKFGESDQFTLVEPENIKPKRLFYNASVEEDISILQQLLDEKKLTRILKGLTKNGLSKGFTLLFYGAPGTGKTETALQLARMSNRMIIQVNMSQVRTMWVGESEKNLQRIFDLYKYNCGVAKRTPILLLNEADALLGHRIDVKHSVDQMNNSMQNILLQAMERFEGILIATTNLKKSLDAAFDRRFLYKVDFKYPETEVRKKIIDSMLPELTENSRCMIATSFTFSGAQLENIKKKFHVYKLIWNREPDMKKVEQWCMEETGSSVKQNYIGFKIA